VCIPNKVSACSFPNATCPADGLPHFTIDFWRNATNEYYLQTEKTSYDKAYEAYVHFNFNEAGEVMSIDVLLVAIMPQEEQEPLQEQSDDLPGFTVINGKTYRIVKLDKPARMVTQS
jgi:hypothetical protein